MKRKAFLFWIFLLFLAVSSEAQQAFTYQKIENKNAGFQERHRLDFGVGLGIENGGLLGVQLEYSPVSRLGIFISGGYYMVAAGYGAGLKGYLMPKKVEKPFRLYALAMYGTNSAIYVEGTSEYNKVYVGPSFGLGMEMRFGKKKANGFNVSLVVPVRSNEYGDDVEMLKNNPYIENFTEPLPVTFSMAYHHEF